MWPCTKISDLEKFSWTFQETTYSYLKVEVEGRNQGCPSAGAHTLQLLHLSVPKLLLSWSIFWSGKVIVGYSMIESNYFQNQSSRSNFPSEVPPLLTYALFVITGTFRKKYQCEYLRPSIHLYWWDFSFCFNERPIFQITLRNLRDSSWSSLTTTKYFHRFAKLNHNQCFRSQETNMHYCYNRTLGF